MSFPRSKHFSGARVCIPDTACKLDWVLLSSCFCICCVALGAEQDISSLGHRGVLVMGGKWGTARTLTSCIYWSCLPQLTDESSITEALFLLTFRFLDLSSTLNLIPVFLIKKMEKFRVEVWVAFPAPVTLTGFSNQGLCVIGSELSLLCLYTVYFCSS